MDEVTGLGPLEPLLRDPSISDILVNTARNVYIERDGRLERAATSFRDNDHLHGRQTRRQDQSFVVRMGHNQAADQPCAHAPTRLPHILEVAVLVLKADIESASEILA